MSARKIYNEGVEYSEYHKNDQAKFLLSSNKVILKFIEFNDLFDKWVPSFNEEKTVLTIMLHTYELCGATYGIQLTITVQGIWELKTYLESGYSKGYRISYGHIALEDHYPDLTNILQGFSPSRYTFD